MLLACCCFFFFFLNAHFTDAMQLICQHNSQTKAEPVTSRGVLPAAPDTAEAVGVGTLQLAYENSPKRVTSTDATLKAAFIAALVQTVPHRPPVMGSGSALLKV